MSKVSFQDLGKVDGRLSEGNTRAMSTLLTVGGTCISFGRLFRAICLAICDLSLSNFGTDRMLSVVAARGRAVRFTSLFAWVMIVAISYQSKPFWESIV